MIFQEAQHRDQHGGLGRPLAQVVRSEPGEGQEAPGALFVSERDGKRLQSNRNGVSVVWDCSDHRL